MWPLAVLLLAGWVLLLRGSQRPDGVALEPAYRAELFALLEMREAVQNGDVPGWLQKLAWSKDLPERIEDALLAADRIGLKHHPEMQVDLTLVCLALDEGDAQNEWEEAALERLARVGAGEGSLYFTQVRAWALNKPLTDEERASAEGYASLLAG